MRKILVTIIAALTAATTLHADLASDYAISTNTEFKKRVVMAILRAAGDIRNQTTNLPTNHESRLAWARAMRDLGAAEQQAGWMTPVIVTADPDLRYAYEQQGDQSDVGDASIINGVNALIDDYANEQYPEEEDPQVSIEVDGEAYLVNTNAGPFRFETPALQWGEG